jgi:hypothetical protein
MKRIAIAGAGILAVLIGMGAIMPALAQVRDQGALPAPFVWSYTLGIFLVTVSLTCAAGSLIRKCGRA